MTPPTIDWQAFSLQLITTFGHFLWQATAVGVGLALVLRLFSNRSANTRYLVACMAFGLLPVCVLATFSAVHHRGSPILLAAQTTDQTSLTSLENPPIVQPLAANARPIAASESDLPSLSSSTPPEPSNPIPANRGKRSGASLLSAASPYLFGLYLIGVTAFSFRIGTSVWSSARLRNAVAAIEDAAIVRIIGEQAARMGLKRIPAACLCERVSVPVVVGFWKPMILLPPAILCGLDPQQLAAILSHEMAHIRRYDLLVNLLQRIVESLLFFHPVTWWISRRISFERENCCDDMAVAGCGRLEFARALLHMAELSANSRGLHIAPHLEALAADGGNPSQLSRRVRRLLGEVEKPRLVVPRSALIVFAIAMTIGCVAMFASAQNSDTKPSEMAGFGPESNGIRCRLVVLPTDANDESPDLSQTGSGFLWPEQMTFGVELKNVSDKPVTLAGIRYDEGYAETITGRLNTNMFAPHLFEFSFTDEAGKPVPRAKREYYTGWLVIANASTHDIAPGQSLTVALRPAKFNAPMDYDLPPGKYSTRVRYTGPDDALKEKVHEHWPDKALLNAWPHSVESNPVNFAIEKPSRRAAAKDLVWGKEVGGLRAAIEFRLPDDVEGNPTIAPGVPVGTSIGVVFHVQNTSDKAITFISETGRQGDTVSVTNQRGEKVEIQNRFFTGWPIDVAWTLQPAETAQLSVLTPSLNSLDQPGEFNVQYTIRFNSRIQKDEQGKVIFPRPGDYDKELDTGIARLFLHDKKLSMTTKSTDRPGHWQITENVEVEFETELVHGPNSDTSIVLRWDKDDPDRARCSRLQLAYDVFGNRQGWIAAWEDNQPVLWYATGWLESRKDSESAKPKAASLHRVDFGNPDCIVDHRFSGWPDNFSASEIIVDALDARFEISKSGKETWRTLHWATPGTSQPRTVEGHIQIFLDEDEKCRVVDLEPGSPPEKSATLDTLADAIRTVVQKQTAATWFKPGTTFYASIGLKPDYPADQLQQVLRACRAAELTHPEVLLAVANKPNSTAAIDIQVVDTETNQPVRGGVANIRFTLNGWAEKTDDKLISQARVELTNAGKFAIAIPDELRGRHAYLQVSIKHPDYVVEQSFGSWSVTPEMSKNPALAQKKLFSDGIIKLKRGHAISGQVLGPDGTPASGISLYAARQMPEYLNMPPHAVTDKQGRFQFRVPGRDGYRLFIISPDAVSVSIPIRKGYGEHPPIRLEAGTAISGQVTGADGKPLADVVVQGNGSDSVYTGFPNPMARVKTDAEGRYSLPPMKLPVDVRVAPLGYLGGWSLRGRDLTQDLVFLPKLFKPLQDATLADATLDFQPAETVTLTARVYDKQGQPATRCEIAIYGEVPDSQRTEDQRGPFWRGRFQKVPEHPGLFQVKAPQGLLNATLVGAEVPAGPRQKWTRAVREGEKMEGPRTDAGWRVLDRDDDSIMVGEPR